MSSKYEYVKADRKRKREAGMVLKHLWVWPSSWPIIQRVAHEQNALAPENPDRDGNGTGAEREC